MLIEQGVIPVLSTKPDQRQGTEQVNGILRQIAEDYKIPLWDFARVAETLPGRGLGPDGVHLTGFYQHDYTLPQAFAARPRRAEFNGVDYAGSDLAVLEDSLSARLFLGREASYIRLANILAPSAAPLRMIPIYFLHDPDSTQIVQPVRSPSATNAIYTRPTGFSAVPPPGPAMPVTLIAKINVQHAPRPARHLERRFRAHRAVRVQRLLTDAQHALFDFIGIRDDAA